MQEAEMYLLADRALDSRSELLETAWFLHAVASAPEALGLYSVERQRRAFQVSAHVFDLVLSNDAALDTPSRLRLAFAAQIGFLRSELTPNTRSLLRLVEGSLSRAPVADEFHISALSAGVALLSLDTSVGFRLLRRLHDEAVTLGGLLTAEDSISTVLGAALGVPQAAWHMLIYLVYGADQRLVRARELLDEILSSTENRADRDGRWVAAHLRGALDGLARSSVWGGLPPDVSDQTRRTLTLGERPVLNLWPPQIDVLASATAGVLDPATRRAFISFPTSAGKSLLAEVIAVDQVARRESGVCYVAPTHSLCREVRNGLNERLRPLRARAVVDTSLASGLNDPTPAAVEVMTPERLSSLLRSEPSETLARFGLFIIDEAHNIGDPDRGWTLETSLAFLQPATRDTEHRLVLLSPAVGNRGHFASWLDPDGTGVLEHSDWRGPRRITCVYKLDLLANPPPRAGFRPGEAEGPRNSGGSRNPKSESTRLSPLDPRGVRLVELHAKCLDLGDLCSDLGDDLLVTQVSRPAIGVADAVPIPVPTDHDGLVEQRLTLTCPVVVDAEEHRGHRNLIGLAPMDQPSQPGTRCTRSPEQSP
jgi:hypothetical protein